MQHIVFLSIQKTQNLQKRKKKWTKYIIQTYQIEIQMYLHFLVKLIEGQSSNQQNYFFNQKWIKGYICLTVFKKAYLNSPECPSVFYFLDQLSSYFIEVFNGKCFCMELHLTVIIECTRFHPKLKYKLNLITCIFLQLWRKFFTCLMTSLKLEKPHTNFKY